MEFLKKLKNKGIMDRSNIFLIGEEYGDMDDDLGKAEYCKTDNIVFDTEDVVIFGNGTSRTTKTCMDNALKIIAFLSESSKKSHRINYRDFEFWVKKDSPVLAVRDGYVCVIAPRVSE